MTHLSYTGDAIYDFSTGLIYKGGRYYDPSQGIWLSTGAVGVVMGLGQKRGNRAQRRRERKVGRVGRGKKSVLLLLLVLLVVLLAGCNEPLPPEATPTATATCTPTAVPSSTPTSTSTPVPSPVATETPAPTHTSPPPPDDEEKIIFFGGSQGSLTGIQEVGPRKNQQTTAWDNHADSWYQYPGYPEVETRDLTGTGLEPRDKYLAQHNTSGNLGGKNLQAWMAMQDFESLKDETLIVIGYSAGADAAQIFSKKFYERNVSIAIRQLN